MRRARSALIRACGEALSSRFVTLRGTAIITGVGFFDIKHGQTGIAPNGIELHPVLMFKLDSRSCTRSAGGQGGGSDGDGGGTGGGGDDCNPNYTPCLPIVDDLDCGDIADSLKPIHVVGSDPYRLRRGWGRIGV